MEEDNVIQLIEVAETYSHKLYAETIEKDYGILFYNDENKESYISNHAVITNPNADLRDAVRDIVAFYRSHKQPPTLYQGFVASEEKLLFPILLDMGFKIQRNNCQPFIRQPGAAPGPAKEHPKMRRLRNIDNGFGDILQEDDGNDRNLKKWIRCIQNPRVFAFSQPNVDGDTVAIAVLHAHDDISVIEDVVTAPSYRRKGFATSLMTQIIELHEKLDNGNPITLNAENPDAIRVYERLGFRALKHRYPLWLAYLEQDPNEISL